MRNGKNAHFGDAFVATPWAACRKLAHRPPCVVRENIRGLRVDGSTEAEAVDPTTNGAWR